MNYKMLVDKENLITKNILNSISFVSIKNFVGEEILVEKKAYAKYKDLQEYLLKKDILLKLVSAYKKNFFSNEVGTGLLLEVLVEFSKIGEFSILFESLSSFGFILREFMREDNKIKIRYVGDSTATLLYNEHLTLEEYHQKYNKSGVLLVNKSSGISSREVDNIISRKFDTKKVGHTGTLDPLASGVLIVLIGNATKIGSDIVCQDKAYIATVQIGIETDTLDITGKVIKEDKNFLIKDLESLLLKFEKTYMQEVPIYSAVKVGGKKLYEYARNGEDVVLPKKEVTIKKLELLSCNKDTFSFFCRVSKGTYIRSLIRDMGESVGTCFTMKELVRTEEAGFKIEDCYTLEEIKDNCFEILSIDQVLHYPVVNIGEDMYKMISNGCVIENIFSITDKVIFKYSGKILAIYEKKGDKLVSYRQFI